MGVDVMRPVFNLEPKYRVTLLTTEERAEENANPPKGTGAEVYGQSVGRRLIISLEKHATAFRAEIYVIPACVHETNSGQDRETR
jgi:hypothetical protein